MSYMCAVLLAYDSHQNAHEFPHQRGYAPFVASEDTGVAENSIISQGL
jgi:uncharacterized protein (DUF1330 family)